MKRKKRVLTVNNLSVNIFKLMQQVESWAQLNILLNLEGIELNDETIIILINFLVMDYYSSEFYNFIKVYEKSQNNKVDLFSNFNENQFNIFKKNILDVVIEISEDPDIKLSSTIIDSLIQKIIFANKRTWTFYNLDSESLKEIKIKEVRARLFKALAKKDPIQVKKSYERYTSFKQYSI